MIEQAVENSEDHAPRVFTRILVIKAPTTLVDVIPFALIFIIYMIMVQAVLSVWKKLHDKSYNIFVLTSILLTMPVLSIVSRRIFSLFFYLLYISFISYLVFKAINFSSDKNAPKLIFKSFKILFVVTTHLTILSQIGLILCFLFFPSYILKALIMACYFIYYAVLSREIVRNLCYLMAQSTGFYSKEGIPGKKDTHDECMICTSQFNTEKKITLKCGHSYHEDCIKGWCLIGQNNSCFYCKDGVDNKNFNQEYWIKSEVMISSMMSTMKSAISFFAIIFVIFLFKTRNESK